MTKLGFKRFYYGSSMSPQIKHKIPVLKEDALADILKRIEDLTKVG
jgi:hypothetical protein